MKFMRRQGDLLFIPIEKLPRKLKKQKDNTIALGEVTGHSHVLEEGSVFKADGEKYLEVPKDSKVVHQEHGPVSLPAGNYLVRRQREYKPAKRRAQTVVD